MRAAVVVFPGSNCDRDVAEALASLTGRAPAMVWHAESALPPCDLVVLPGGFSYGDYLRCGAIAARAPVMGAVAAAAARGVAVLGICNGFQILTEAGLLPGALMRNRGLRFVCRTVGLTVGARSLFTASYGDAARLRLPVAHMDGCYTADAATLERLEGEGRIAFRYAPGENPNGSARDIAGITDGRGRILGLMPHPERAVESYHPTRDGRPLLAALAEALA